MAWTRFGFAGPGDDLPIDQWMDDQNDYMGLRDALDAAGREAWDASTRSGDNFQASRPTDVVALGSTADQAHDGLVRAPPESTDSADESAPKPEADGQSSSAPRYVKARPGDNIARLVGSSDPTALGAFARANGMDGSSSTIYAGRVYTLPGAADDVAPSDTKLGEHLLRHDNSRLAALRASNAASDQFAAALGAGLNVWTGRDPYGPLYPTAPQQGPQSSWADRSVPLKAIAGTGAFVAGLPYGFARGAVHLGQGIYDTVDFGLRLADPLDAEHHPLDEPARDVVRDVGHRAVSYARAVAADPRIAVNDAGDLVQDANVHLNPFATPMAPTLSEEMLRDLGIGANDGELGFQVATAMEGGGEAAALRAAKPLSQGEKIAKLLSEGYDEATAAHLAEPYVGQGSHYVPRRTRIPALSSKPISKRLLDSPFNVSKPEGMSRDEFYRYHYAVDPSFHGARLPAGIKGLNGHAGWRGSDLNLTKYGPLGRAWHGAPVPLKRTGTALGVAPGFAAFESSGDDEVE